jgi:lipopolysaccharide biosynthesis regulator YciM
VLSEEKENEAELEADAMDLFGAATLLERRGESERSARFMSRALEGRLSEEITVLAKTKLASHFKRNRDWPRAIRLWQEMAPFNQLTSYRELAMYYEHKERDYKKAREVAEEGLAAASGTSRSLEKDFSHRLERLKRKLERREKKGAE